MAKVKIKKLPKALSGLEIKMQPGLYGTNGNRQFTLATQVNSQKFAQQPTEVRNTLQPVPRSEANLEAEKGETAVVNMGGMPAHFKIGGKRHSQGGTPLSLPDNSFIFSDTAKMKIKDPNILAQFGMSTKKGGYTPAEIAKKYDINTYRKILSDPNTEDVERKTAERMIANYNLKLAKLSLAQESIKGFPQGIPVIAMPYINANNVNPADYFPTQGQEDQPDADTGEARYGGNIISQFRTKKYGGLLKAQDGYAAGYMPEGYPGTTLPEVEVTAPFDYVKKGFSGNKEEELAFATDPKTKAAYMAYRDAMRSKDPVLLRNTLNSLEKTFALPFSKITDLRGVLRDELGEKSFRQKIGEFLQKGEKQKTERYKEEKEKVIPKAYLLYAKLKSLAEDPSISSLERNEYNNLLKETESLLPGYKNSWLAKQARGTGDSGWDFFSNTVNTYEINKDGQFEKIDPMYSQEEIDYIDLQLEMLDKATKSKPAKTKEAGILTDIPEQPVVLDSDTAGLGAFKQKYKIKKEGGALTKYNGGGKVIANDGKFKSYEDGSILNIKTGKWAQQADPNWKPSSTSGNVNQPINTIDPYAGYTSEELAELLEDPSILRKSKVAGKQKTGQSGTYGTSVSIQEFIKRNPEYVKKFKETYNRDFTEADAETFQKDYNQHVEDLAYNRAQQAGYDDDKAKSLAKRFAQSQGFKQGKLVSGDPSFIDKKFGEYTSSRFEPSFKPLKKQDPAKPTPPAAKKEEKKSEDQVVNRYSPKEQPIVPANAPWWLQDIIKVSGAAADSARIKKYQPWQATPGYSLPDATFYDPTRELAANTEAANVAMQAQQAFSNPQQLAAASSVAQGQMAKNAADIMGRYNNLNVTLANQLNQQRTDIMNTASANQAGMNTQLYDKYTTVNQQFDNSKALARQKLRQSYIDGITNKAKTQALNSLYPNFYTDPTSGGNVYANPYYKPDPTIPSSDSEYDAAFEKYGPQGIDSYMDWKYGKSKKGRGRSRNRYEDYQGYPGTSGSYTKTAEEEEEE